MRSCRWLDWRKVAVGWLLGAVFVAGSGAAWADPDIEIFLSKGYGRMGDYRFDVLGGRPSHPTPKGSFVVQTKAEDFYSRKYKAPMPYSVFFTRQAAIHSGSLSAESHGCIHVSRSTARRIFSHAEPGHTRVIVHP